MTKECTAKWEAIDSGELLWTAQYKIPNFISRSVVFPAKEKGLIVVSPGASLAGQLPPGLKDSGEPTLAFLPNSFHFMGFPVWKKLYPELVAVANSKAHGRLANKRIQEVQGLEILIKQLPLGFSLLEPPDFRYGETWIKIKNQKEVIWIVCDAFFNHPRLSHKPIARTMQKLFKAAPGLCVSFLVKNFMIRNAKNYKRWLSAEIQKDPPTILVPSHGGVLKDPQLSEKILALVQKRL